MSEWFEVAYPGGVMIGPAEQVENAHDQGNRPVFKAPLSNNVTDRLAPAPEG